MRRFGGIGGMVGIRAALATTAVAALAVGAAGCSGSGSGSGGSNPGGSPGSTQSTVKLPDLHGQHLELAAVWTGPEQQNGEKILKEFERRTGATVSYTPTGDSASTFLGTKIEGGQPPDVALLAQPGVLRQFAQKGWIKPVDSAVQAQLNANYSKGWRDLGAYQGKQYGVPFKAANKSLIWYNTAAFQNAGISSPPTTWADFLKTAQTISDSGTPPVSVGGADGWPLTDWFENIYLSQAGPAAYDKLAQHTLKWTDPSVAKALQTLGQLFGKDQLLAGGHRGALQTDFPKSVTQTFTGNPPGAAMVYEGDFVAGFIEANTKAKVGADAKVFPFPAVGATPPVVVGADTAVLLKDNPGAQALMTFLASPDAARIWAQAGGFLSPDKSLALSVYPDETTRTIAKALIGAGDSFRFDMSDQSPAAFGGTKGEGEWKDLQDFLANPSNVAGAQQKLEADAARAYGNG